MPPARLKQAGAYRIQFKLYDLGRRTRFGTENFATSFTSDVVMKTASVGLKKVRLVHTGDTLWCDGALSARGVVPR